MNEDKEKISAYLDDALPQGELDALTSMADMSARQRTGRQGMELGVASRYQIIGDVLRGQMGDASMIDVRLQMREALRDEKMVASVDADHRAYKKRSIFSSGFGSWFNQTLFSHTWYRPLGGLAVAASVAMIVVVTVTHEETTFDKGNLVAEIAAGNTAIEDTTISNVSVVSAPAVSVAVSTSLDDGTRAQDAIAQTYSQVNTQTTPQVNLDAYLAEHAEFAAQDTMQGRIPYARAVSYEAE
jgi:negative regulator of sigma E activity